jgi:hypothetical protein
VASLVILATELTIKWNKLRGVNSLSSVGQTIPFIIGVGSLVCVFYVYLEPILAARFGRGTQAESAQEAGVPPGPLPFEVMPVPYSAPMEWVGPNLETRTR